MVLPISLRATEAVVPGPRMLIVRIFTFSSDASTSEGLVATLPFAVEVFGESAILQVVGVPLLLLLPGVIIVVVTRFLMDQRNPWPQASAWTSIKNVLESMTAVALFSLLLSLVMAKAYPLLTEWFIPGYERDYLRAYGFLDFYLVISYSFLAALVLWGLAWLLAITLKAFGWIRQK